ncbi:MAG TPA: N-acetyltransferase, partial [Thermotogota bacterium]|nr:N-acetyltransferase [Thermotogota bacterium]
MELRALDESQINVLIALVNEVFADYPIPIRWTVRDFHLDILETGLSLKDSFILWEGQEPVGFIVVGIRD